jgi:hypothetical protein
MKRIPVLLCMIVLMLGYSAVSYDRDWGFFGHRTINRLAVFTLPDEMFPLFKTNIDFITDHAVDPDKRRYAFRLEASRHFMDMDMYKSRCFPATMTEGFASYGILKFYRGTDSLLIHVMDSTWCSSSDLATVDAGGKYYYFPKAQIRHIYGFNISPAYYNEKYVINPDSFRVFAQAFQFKPDRVEYTDNFTIHGIVPYYVAHLFDKLVTAFIVRDPEKIINIATNLGHYIADAHVPLHACSNYNGQKTDQYGIHAFWESRIPELFADEQYDYLVGKSHYIPDINSYIRNVIQRSAQLSDSVLTIERVLKRKYPADKQLCYEERSGKYIWTQCRDFAASYQDAMQGMVESRMRESISGVGSVWYSAWVKAGKPDLDFSKDIKVQWMVDSTVIKGEQIRESGGSGEGRGHE